MNEDNVQPQDQSLEILRNSQLAAAKDAPAGLDGFPDALVNIPRLIIGQPGNMTDYEPGKFNNNLTGETFESMNVVLIRMQRSRTLWPEGVPKQGDAPSCRAYDAKVADQEFYGKMCSRCNDVHQECSDDQEQPICAHAKFTKSGRPDCRLAYHLLVASIDNGDVFILTITGKGISPTNRLLSSFKVKGKPAYSAKFKVSLKQSNDKRYYSIVYSDFKWLDSADELKELFDKYKERPITPNPKEEVTDNDSKPEEILDVD